MKSRSGSFIYILTFGLLLSLFLIYRYGFKDRFFNISTQTTTIDLSLHDKAFLIEKHAEQGEISQLELRITGKLSDNISLHLSENALTARTSIRLKKGKIDTSFLTRWSKDHAYILIENPAFSKSRIEIDYQFVTE